MPKPLEIRASALILIACVLAESIGAPLAWAPAMPKESSISGRFTTQAVNVPSGEFAHPGLNQTPSIENIKEVLREIPQPAIFSSPLDDGGLPESLTAYLFKALGFKLDEEPPISTQNANDFECRTYRLRSEQLEAFNGIFQTPELKKGDAWTLVLHHGEPIALAAGPLKANFPYRKNGIRILLLPDAPPSIPWNMLLPKGFPFQADLLVHDIYFPQIGRSLAQIHGTYTPKHPDAPKILSSEVLLETFPEVRGRVIGDAGCGIGVQSFQALTAGAARVVAFDKNPLAAWITLYNARRLGYRDRLQVYLTDNAETLPTEAAACDLWVSNLSAAVTTEEMMELTGPISGLAISNNSDPEIHLLSSLLTRLTRLSLEHRTIPELHFVFSIREKKVEVLKHIIRPTGWILSHQSAPDNLDAYTRYTLRYPGLAQGPAKWTPPPEPSVEPLLDDDWPASNVLSTQEFDRYNRDKSKMLTPSHLNELVELVKETWRTMDPLSPLRSIYRFKGGSFSNIMIADTPSADFAVEIPKFDDPPTTLKSRRDTVHKSYHALSGYRQKGLKRYLPRKRALFKTSEAENSMSISMTEFFHGYHELNFSNGRLRLWDTVHSRLIPFSPIELPELLAEIAAVLVYHYDPDENGGTSVTDFYLNHGDLIYFRNPDGSHDLKLITIRDRATGIDRNTFLHSLVQLAAFEEMWPDEAKFHHMEKLVVQVPVLISNPSIAFEGLRRGLLRRYQDLGLVHPERQSQRDMDIWLRQFAVSDQGRRYAPWVDRYLQGKLPLEFGKEPIEGQPPLPLLEDHLKHLRLEGKGLAVEETSLRSQYDEVSRYIEGRIKSLRSKAPAAPSGETNDLIEQFRADMDILLGIKSGFLTREAAQDLFEIASLANPKAIIKKLVEYGKKHFPLELWNRTRREAIAERLRLYQARSPQASA